MKTTRTLGHFNRISRIDAVHRRRAAQKHINESAESDRPTTTLGSLQDLKTVTQHIYTEEEISRFSMELAINKHPLARKPTGIRSKLAYSQIIKEVPLNTRYLLPGMFAVFGYREPKTKDKLEYYDGTPATIFFGITRTKTGAIRELGFNLHYFPPFARARIIELVYKTFQAYYNKYFNDVPRRPNKFVDYNILLKMLKQFKIEFGLRMYIPVLRGKTYVLPTRLIATAAYTEGHFSGATLSQIQKYWRAKTK